MSAKDLQEATEALEKTVRETTSAVAAKSDAGIADVKRALDVQKDAFNAEIRSIRDSALGGNSECAVYVRADGAPVLSRAQGAQGRTYGLLDDPEPRSKQQKRAQSALTLLNLARVALAGPMRSAEWIETQVAPLHARAVAEISACGPQFGRIFSGSSSALGAALMPANIFPDLVEALRLPAGAETYFPMRQIPNRSGTFSEPTRNGLARIYKGAAPTINNPASGTQSKRTYGQRSVSPDTFYGILSFDRDAELDAQIDVLASEIAGLSVSTSYAGDDVLINSDTAATHQDVIAGWNPNSIWEGTDGTGTDLDPRTSALGLRADSYDNSTTLDMSALKTYAGLLQLIGVLDPACQIQFRPGGAGVLFVSIQDAGWIIRISEIASMEKTLNPGILSGFGGFSMPSGVLKPGQIGEIMGCPIVVTPFLARDLASTGLRTGSGSTSAILAVDSSRYAVYRRKDPTVELGTDIYNNTDNVVIRYRSKFQKRSPNYADKTVACGFNLS